MKLDDPIFVAGHRGLVGSALTRRLAEGGYRRVLVRGRDQLDLSDGPAVRAWFEAERPRFVFLAAARVGGILANATHPVPFLRDNLAIELAVLDAAHATGVEKLLFLGSSCVYPKLAPQPITEDALLTGPLEPTNEAYALAKIAGIKLCEAYRREHGDRFFAVMPTNLYGPNDNFDLESSHVLPALLRRFHEAKVSGAPSVELWGTGSPRREFLHVDDLADACVFLMERYEELELINIGVGKDIEIREVAELIRRIVGYEGEIRWDRSKPDGTPRKLLDVGRLTRQGWTARIGLEAGLRETYDWYRRSIGAPVPA